MIEIADDCELLIWFQGRKEGGSWIILQPNVITRFVTPI